MIARLKGRLAEKHPNLILLDVHGIFFEINISINCYSNLPALNDTCELPVVTIFKEEGTTLYGFANDDEKQLFILLNTVSKIGPKLAISILSTATIEKLKSAIKNKDANTISAAPGVGKKTAERIILELGDKIGEIPLMPGEEINTDIDTDVISALMNLGYKKIDCTNALKKINTNFKSFEERFRESLKLLTNI
jgi:Holliday junction DNA helicase RuvA